MSNRAPEPQELTHALPHDPIPGASLGKPPTQVAGAQGFVAFEAEPSPPPERIDWPRLCNLPAFQMYAAERYYKSIGEIDRWLRGWSKSQSDLKELYDNYCQWHKAKGYWPNETPTGELI